MKPFKDRHKSILYLNQQLKDAELYSLSFFFLKYIKEKIDLWESKFLFTNLKEVNTTNASAKF